MTHTNRLIACALTTALAVAAGFTTISGQGSKTIESFSALAFQPGAPPGQTTMNVDLLISRWSTAAEHDALMATLLEKPTKILDLLQKMPSVGRLSTPGGVGYDLRYAEHSTSGGTERVLLLTDRPVGFGEASDQSRTLDYPVTVIELRVQPSGQGEGKVAVAARLMVNRASKEIMVEDWNISPVQLRGLKRDRR